MIYDEDDQLQPVQAGSSRCSIDNCANPATWNTLSSTPGAGKVNMCAWHVMYGGSAWGMDRRAEIALVGRSAKSLAENHGAQDAHVPILDVEGRMKPLDAERYIMGVKYTTLLVKGRLGRVLTKGGGK